MDKLVNTLTAASICILLRERAMAVAKSLKESNANIMATMGINTIASGRLVSLSPKSNIREIRAMITDDFIKNAVERYLRLSSGDLTLSLVKSALMPKSENMMRNAAKLSA